MNCLGLSRIFLGDITLRVDSREVRPRFGPLGLEIDLLKRGHQAGDQRIRLIGLG